MQIENNGYMDDELKYRVFSDFPKEGIEFIDLTPSSIDANTYKAVLNGLQNIMKLNELEDFDYVIAPEARGFIYGSHIASVYNKGFIPMRKPGKLPDEAVIRVEYEKEYGKDILCVPNFEEYKGKRILFIDDIYATGGTYLAAKKFCEIVDADLLGSVVIATILEEYKKEKDLYSLFHIIE